MVQPLWETAWRFLKKLKIELKSYGFTYLWSIRNNTEDTGRRREVSWGKSEGEKNHERLWTHEKQTEGFGGRCVERWVSLVVGIMEGTYCMEHWVWYINDEFWNTGKKFKKSK